MEPSAQKLAIVRVSRNRQGEPSPASKTIECASSRRLSRLASANVTRPDAGRLSLASPRTQLVSRPEEVSEVSQVLRGAVVYRALRRFTTAHDERDDRPARKKGMFALEGSGKRTDLKQKRQRAQAANAKHNSQATSNNTGDCPAGLEQAVGKI